MVRAVLSESDSTNRLFSIETNVTAIQPKQSMPTPERVAIEWQDAFGDQHSQIERVPPFPTGDPAVILR